MPEEENIDPAADASGPEEDAAEGMKDDQEANAAADAAAEVDSDLAADETPTDTSEGNASPPPAEASASLSFEDFTPGATSDRPAELDLLGDVQLNVTIELGRTRMLVEDVLRLSDGAVVELDKLAGDPVDVYVNERLIARGEVLVMNDNFSIRVNEILDIAAIEEANRSRRPTGTDG